MGGGINKKVTKLNAEIKKLTDELNVIRQKERDAKLLEDERIRVNNAEIERIRKNKEELELMERKNKEQLEYIRAFEDKRGKEDIAYRINEGQIRAQKTLTDQTSTFILNTTQQMSGPPGYYQQPMRQPLQPTMYAQPLGSAPL